MFNFTGTFIWVEPYPRFIELATYTTPYISSRRLPAITHQSNIININQYYYYLIFIHEIILKYLNIYIIININLWGLHSKVKSVLKKNFSPRIYYHSIYINTYFINKLIIILSILLSSNTKYPSLLIIKHYYCHPLGALHSKKK